jgi:hypothetical protein
VAPLPVIANVYRCAIEWRTAAGQTAVNVLNIFSTTRTATQIAGDLGAHVATHQFDAVSSDWSAQTVVVTPLDGTSAGQPHALANWVGAGDPEFVPAAAVLISVRTPTRGPKARGRIYLPGASESHISDGLVDTTANANMQIAWDTWRVDMDAAGSSVGVASYKHAAFYLATAITAERPLATQRRRQSRLRI